jgi:hypothetical protein
MPPQSLSVRACAAAGPNEFDIAMVDMTVSGGPEVARDLRQARPVVRVGRRCDAVRGQDDLLQSGFTLELLGTLNRVVEEVLLGRPAAQDEIPSAALVRDGEGSRRPRALIVDDSRCAASSRRPCSGWVSRAKARPVRPRRAPHSRPAASTSLSSMS